MLIKTILIWSKNYRIMSKSGLHHINIRDKLILLMNCPKQLQEKSDVLSLEIRKSKRINVEMKKDRTPEPLLSSGFGFFLLFFLKKEAEHLKVKIGQSIITFVRSKIVKRRII